MARRSRAECRAVSRAFPAVADQQSLVLDVVCGELRAARALGLTVDAHAYVARCPVLAKPIRRQMEVSNWLVDEG